ncbi:MAG: DegT/DnrJ/EryC1/StrS family aminotransferase [Candidatus Firestonebacteria bacterium]|nr:DegT/DnrJ/EryC1/StrS family aminotransferase [Candidatus Firestonebacteria bacterium]
MKKIASPQVPFINLPAQHRKLQAHILAALERTLAGAHFILGPETQALEKEIAGLCGARFGLGLNSGTDALLLSLRALEVGPGDEVIVPDFTFMATASAVMLAGATPVLADVDPVTYTLSPAAVKKCLTRRTRAIVPVHLYGQAADMTRLLALARTHRLAVVEDACQALGATWQGKPVGALGDAGCLSFFPTKNLGGIGDGGMVVTNRPELAARVKRLRNHGSEEKYRHLELGYNSRLDEVQSAVLRVKLPQLKRWNQQRRNLAGLYARALDASKLVLPAVRAGAGHVYHQYAVQTDLRDALAVHLKSRGVETAVHYPLALHQQPIFARLPSARRLFPVAEKLARRVLCLPITPETSPGQARRVAREINAFFDHKPSK